MNDELYEFKFESLRRFKNNDHGMIYKIYSESLNDISTFCAQHNFDINCAKDAIVPVDRGTVNLITSRTLKVFKFKSNIRQGVFDIMTTENFMDIIIENMASDLAQTLMFGESIFRTDLELFKTITELMGHMKHAKILDFAYVDTDSTDLNKASFDIATTAQELIALNTKYSQMIGCPSEDAPVLAIQDALSMDLLNNDVSPITLEGYISGFTELMIDVFN